MVLVSLFLLIGVTGGAYFLLESKKDNNRSSIKKKPDTDASLKTVKPAPENVASSSKLEVQGVETEKLNDKSLLALVDFEQYEQFANNETASYQEIVAGTGQEVANGDTIAVVYKGWLTDGRLFDQSRTNELNQLEPFIFKFGDGQVIAGWEQGIFGMEEGGKRRLVIPASQGYGEAGKDPIPPNSMLIFDIELVQVQKP